MVKNMQKLLRFWLLILLSIKSVCAQISSEGFAPIVKPLLNSVVSISTVQKMKADKELDGIPQGLIEEFMKRLPPSLADDLVRRKDRSSPRRKPKAFALGAGFIIEYDQKNHEAYIVTNDHLVESAQEISVHFKDDSSDSEIKATLIGRDPRTDLALIKIKTKIPLKALGWGDSDGIQVGEWAIAIGNPFGLGNTVTVGVVSHHGRDIPHADYVNGFIQTDAPLNTGNSGGPLFNIKGEVIGVNVGRIVPGMGDGVGFAIPANIAQKTIAQLRKHGRTKRGWIGIGFQAVTKTMMEALKRPNTTGALIGMITKDGPADKAGLKRGDLVVRLGSTKIKDTRGLPQLIGEMEVGSTVEVEVIRDGSPVVAHVTLGEFEKAQKEGKIDDKSTLEAKMDKAEGDAILGMRLADISEALIKDRDLPASTKGVIVVDIDTTSEAFEVGLRPDDIIEAINMKPLKSVTHLKRIVKRLRTKKTTTILLSVRRNGKEMPFITLSLDEPDQNDMAEKDEGNEPSEANKNNKEEAYE